MAHHPPVRIIREHHVHFMTSSNAPVARIRPGQRVTVETMDALDGNVITLDGQALPVEPGRRFAPDEVNPATGPLYIDGAKPGDGLAVHILDVRLVGTGYMGVHKGAFGGAVKESLRLFFTPHAGRIQFGRFSFPADPMIGVIGVAPQEGEVWNQNPGDHGGNMDTALIRKGATVYLPVFHPGALLALGDVHMLMGDGEVNGQGIEAYAEVDLVVEVMPDWRAPRPLVETADLWATIASHENLETACRMATADMVRFLEEQAHLTSAEAALPAPLRLCRRPAHGYGASGARNPRARGAHGTCAGPL